MRLYITLICLASTQSLHVRHEISVHCTRPVWDNSQACLYNMAFEVNPKHVMENFKVMDATKSMDRKEEGKEEEKGRKEGRKGGKGERKVLGGVWDGHVCLTLSDDG